jgi:hypothetical protein
MSHQTLSSVVVTALTVCALGLSSPAFAYDENDAIRDCNKRMKSEYNLNDFRSESAQKLSGEGHRFKVSGKTKVDGDKYDYSCDIKDRAVVSIAYNGPKREGMKNSEKVAIGAAAAVATAIAVDAMTKDKDAPAEPTVPAAPEPVVKTLPGGGMEVRMSADCSVDYNDIGMRSGHDSACTPEQLTAANKAVTKELSGQRANAN